MREEGPRLVSTDFGLAVRLPSPALPLSFSYSFKTLLLLFKNELDGREVASPTLQVTHSCEGVGGGGRKSGVGWGRENSLLKASGSCFLRPLLEGLWTGHSACLFENQVCEPNACEATHSAQEPL